MSDWQVHIQQDWMNAGVKIVWYRDLHGGGREVSNGTVGWVVRDDNAVDPAVEPLGIREDMLRVLHQGLLRHFDGADDARMLRKDYDAERARVDKLIDLATRPPGGAA